MERAQEMLTRMKIERFTVDKENRMNDMNQRIDELHKKMDYALFEIKKANISFQNVAYSYGGVQKEQSVVAGKGARTVMALR